MIKNLQLPHAEALPSALPLLLNWYQAHHRDLPWRMARTAYHTWISEIMLQQTRASTVIPYYERFLDALPDIAALATVPEDTLMKLWQGLGYYSRARNLQKAARILQTDYAGQMPDDFASLLALPGIGRYTAAAIGSMTWGKPWPAVDGNVLRIIMRHLAAPLDIAKESTKRLVERELAAIYPTDGTAGDLNQAFMDLGATICLPNGAPHCAACPLASLCLAHREGSEQELPIKMKDGHRRVEERTVLLICQGPFFVILRRPPKGLLASLWEFPNLPGHLTRADIRSYLSGHQLTYTSLKSLPTARHIFSHVEWHLTGWRIELAPDCPASASVSEATDHCWVSRDELASTYSLPTAFHAYLPYLPV